jgi:hypothetical protein
MGGIVFPSVANALMPLIQMDRQAEESRLNRERLQKHDEWLMEDRKQARELQTQQHALRLDEAQRAKIKDAADATTQAALGVLNAPEAERPAAYATALQFLKQRGHDTSNLPQAYSPGIDGMLRFYVQKAESASEFLKRQGEMPQPMGPAGAPGAGDVMARAGNAIAGIESGGKYDAVGPMTGGDRAYGKYQVMGANVPTWTQEVLGRPMTPQEFLANPQAQDAVFKAKFGQYAQKYGPEGAARAWFAGEGGMNNPNAADVNGMTVSRYGQKFAQAGGFTPTNTPAQSIPGGLPQVAQGDAIAGQGDAPPRPSNPAEIVRGVQLPPGARIMAQKGIPIVKDGTVMILKADGTPDFVPLPQRAPPKEQGAGPFAGSGVEAQALNMLVGNGTLTIQQAAELAAGKTITNPADGSVIFMTPSGIFQRPSGQGAPTPAPGAPGAPPSPSPSGNIQVTPPKPKEMTEGQANAALYADRIRSAEKIIAENEKAGLDIQGKILEKVPLGNYLQSESYQKLEQARRDFINAVLRRESGAVISDAEFDNARIQYFPRPGDTPEILKQKAENRRIALDGITRAAGPVYAKERANSSAGSAKPGTYMGPDNRPISWNEIEATAKNRGITPDEVVQRLGLKPAGGQ